MSDLFERLKQIPASEAAQRQGIELKRNGYKFWACCPLHGERTPSMCFYPNGSWYCFGCHQGGDAVTLYEKMMQVSSLEAAERFQATRQISRVKSQSRLSTILYRLWKSGAVQNGTSYAEHIIEQMQYLISIVTPPKTLGIRENLLML